MFQVLEILGENPRFSDPVYEIDLNEGKKCYCIKDFSELSDQSKKDTLSTIIDYPEQVIRTDLSKTLEEEFQQSQYRCCPTTYLIVENGIIIKAFDKIKAADNTEQMLGELD